MRDAVLITFGTTGDIVPFLVLGNALKEQGYKVTIVTYDLYQKMVEHAGLNYIGCDSTCYLAMTKHKDLYHPVKFISNLFKIIYASMRETYDIIISRFDPQTTVLVAHFPLVIGARIAHEKFNFPLATIFLSPVNYLSAENPPHLAILPPFIHHAPLVIKRGIMKLLASQMNYFFRAELNEFRNEIGLVSINDGYQWLPSPERIICLYPSWFADIPSDWPKQTRQTGFINSKRKKAEDLVDSLKDFLDSGTPPIVYTHGSFVDRNEKFYEVSIEVTKQLGARAIIFTNQLAELNQLKLKNIMFIERAPYNLLFPKALAIVHHAGIGAITDAFESGIPQLAVPRTLDQFENAFRLEETGCGMSLPYKKYTAQRAKNIISELIESKIIHEKCRAYAKKVDFNVALIQTCKLIGDLFKDK